MAKPITFRAWVVRHFGRVVVLPALLLVMFLYDSALAHCEEVKRAPAYAFYGAVGAADFASTEIALRRPGTREGNPLPGLQSIGGRAAIKTLTIVGLSELDRALARRRKPKAMWGVRVGVLLLTGYAVQHNLRVR